MIGLPGVVDALNTLLFIEITLHEAAHAWEKVFECHKYKRLRVWMDKQIFKSRCRRRYLEKRIVCLGGTIEVDLQPGKVDPATPIAQVLADSSTFFNGLLDSYRKAWATVYEAGDTTTADELCQLQKKVEGAIFQLEAFNVQIKDIGIVPWTQSQL